jgi:hypothetical protein
MLNGEYLNKISFFQSRRDEIPNKLLAKELAAADNKAGIAEIADNLWNDNKNIQSDCLKVLYEIGYLKPELIADYVEDFLKLITHRNNRLVWGGMIALATIASIKAEEILGSLDKVISAMRAGSVITVDSAVKVLSAVSSKRKEYSDKIFPLLIEHLQSCRPKEIPQHAESILVAVNASNKTGFLAVLKSREDLLTPPQMTRVKKLYRALERLD